MLKFQISCGPSVLGGPNSLFGIGAGSFPSIKPSVINHVNQVFAIVC